MLSKKPKKSGWINIHKAMESFDRDAFLQLVKDLYQLSEDNRTFLHSRCSSGGDSLPEVETAREASEDTDGYYAATMRRLFAEPSEDQEDR